MSSEENMDTSNTGNIVEQQLEAEAPIEVSFVKTFWMFTFRGRLENIPS